MKIRLALLLTFTLGTLAPLAQNNYWEQGRWSGSESAQSSGVLWSASWSDGQGGFVMIERYAQYDGVGIYIRKEGGRRGCLHYQGVAVPQGNRFMKDPGHPEKWKSSSCNRGARQFTDHRQPDLLRLAAGALRELEKARPALHKVARPYLAVLVPLSE